MLHVALTFPWPVDFLGIIMIYHTAQVPCRLKTHRSLFFSFVKICIYSMSPRMCDRWLLSINIELCKAHKKTSAVSWMCRNIKACRATRKAIIIFSILKSGLQAWKGSVRCWRHKTAVSLFSSLYSMICIQLSMHKMCWGILPHL